MNKELLTDIALQVGGSHYPSVSKPYLETTVRLVVEQCIDIAKRESNTDSTVTAIKEHFGIK